MIFIGIERLIDVNNGDEKEMTIQFVLRLGNSWMV